MNLPTGLFNLPDLLSRARVPAMPVRAGAGRLSAGTERIFWG